MPMHGPRKLVEQLSSSMFLCLIFFKQHVRKSTTKLSKFANRTNDDVFDLCLLVSDAFEKSITRAYILVGFKKAGVNLIGPGELLCVPRPASEDQPSTMVSVL